MRVENYEKEQTFLVGTISFSVSISKAILKEKFEKDLQLTLEKCRGWSLASHVLEHPDII